MKQNYLDFALKIANQNRNGYEENLLSAKNKTILDGNFLNFEFLHYLVYVEYSLFKYNNDNKAKENAVRMLNDLGQFMIEYNKTNDDNYHILSWMFGTSPFIRAYDGLKCYLEPEIESILYKGIEFSINRILLFPEHGSHNRVMLRCLNLLTAAKYLSDSEYVNDWNLLGDSLLKESLNKWSIEDAITYLPIWLSLLIQATEITNQEDRFYRHPIARYYADYLLNLMSPNGMIPGFGDGRLGSSWATICSVFEKFANVYHDGRYKWAAKRMFESVSPIDDGKAHLTLKMGESFIDAFEWSNDEIEIEVFDDKSCEVMDEIVGKKIVFRSGLKDKDSYLLLNYKDEEYQAHLAKFNIKNSIPVLAERTHHGHADENSIVSLMSNGSVLLRDGGYRNNSGTVEQWRKEWRADTYHNTVLLRDGLINNTSFFDYCNGNGHYLPITTEKIYFYKFDEVDVSRTRKTNNHVHLENDRCIHYLKELNIFVVVDFIKALSDINATFGTQYFTREIKPVGDYSYITSYDYIGSDEFLEKIPNDNSNKLLITFPNKFNIETQETSRGYTTETSVSNFVSKEMVKNEYIPIVSVLTPCNEDIDVKSLEKSIKVDVTERNVTINIELENKSITLGLRSNFEAKIFDTDIRPSYNYTAGISKYGKYESDAYFLYVSESKKDLNYAFIDATRIDYNQSTIFKVGEVEHLQIDKTDQMGISSWPSFEKRIDKKDII